MGISRIYMNRLAILTVLVALSVGMAVAVNSGVGASNKTSNVGSNATAKVSITGVNSTEIDQWIEIANNGTSNVNFTGWKLMNKENLTYALPASFVLKPGAKVKVHSIAGKPNSTDLYNSSVLLNETGDMAILKDATGKVVSKYSYPALSTVVAKPTTNATKPKVITPNVEYKANTTKTTISNVTTNTAKDITKITKSN
ncbi:Lamin Tail Domain protein [uncultured archaeon]|nr:Lamin Tail Domain protein [uncultured archaeon]